MNMDPGCFAWMDDDDGPKPKIKSSEQDKPLPSEPWKPLPLVSGLEGDCATELALQTGQGDEYCRDVARVFLILYRLVSGRDNEVKQPSTIVGPVLAETIRNNERARIVRIIRERIDAHLERVEIARDSDGGCWNARCALLAAELRNVLSLIEPQLPSDPAQAVRLAA